jgi:hypothetical protein
MFSLWERSRDPFATWERVPLDDRCLKQAKTASGISVFLLEELGDARLRTNQLKNYIDEANELIEKSEHRDHFFEVAGHLLHAIPDTLMRVTKSLDAAAMAVARWDYEEIKDDLRPEKVEQLEDALKDVRVRRVKRKSSQPESRMRVQDAAVQLKRVAAQIEETGHVDTESLTRLIASLEGDAVRTASSNQEVAVTLRRLAHGLGNEKKRPSRLMLAAILRRVLGDSLEVKAAAGVKTADAGDLGVDGPYNMSLGFDYIRDAARIAYIRGTSGSQMRQAFDQLASIVSEIGLMCDSIGASDVAGLAIRMSKAVRLARRYLKPDVMDSMVLASDEKESRFEEGKPADPTKDMSEEDAKAWKANTDKYEDKFKSASDEKESRFEEGKPADPTKDMSEEDAKAWKANTDKYEDKFKSASDEKESRFEEGKPADPTDNMSDEEAKEWESNTDKYKDKFKKASGGSDPWKV